MNESQDDAVEQMLDQYLRGEALNLDEIDTELRSEVESLTKMAEALWTAAHGAPAMADDPVALRLGLVPDDSVSLDPKALQRLMKVHKQQPSSVAKALRDREWDVSTRDVFNWQTKSTSTIPPALIRALAAVIGSTSEQLTVVREPSAARRAMLEATRTTLFDELAQRWARIRKTSIDTARTALAARMEATVHRGSEPDAGQMLRSLNSLVTALESKAADDDLS